MIMEHSADAENRELVYMDRILHGYSVQSDAETDIEHSQVYFRQFRFSFQQLDVKIEANRLHLDTQRFSSVLRNAESGLEAALCDDKQSLQVAEFAPERIPIRGRWMWSLMELADICAAHVARRIELSMAGSRHIIFTYR
tara:strand:- start:204 stop:623 length:420 start_codon:yes stop_codon:yes gene_type:complete